MSPMSLPPVSAVAVADLPQSALQPVGAAGSTPAPAASKPACTISTPIPEAVDSKAAPSFSSQRGFFSRGLTTAELDEVRALLRPEARARLQELVKREFNWAMTAAAEDGCAASASEGSSAGEAQLLGYSVALVALRQLSYLNGLPALDSATACSLFDMYAASAASVVPENATLCTQTGSDSRCISLVEFEACFIHLLQAALECPPVE